MEVSGPPRNAQDTFENNSIPDVRAIEKQLRATVSRDRERLRALVGGNYRDLLSTADAIVALDEKTKKVEQEIASLSQKCKPPQNSDVPRSISSPSSTSAQLRLLVQCVTYAAKALQTRAVLQCAQLTVISRLLLKSLAEGKSPPKSAEALKDKADALRRRLLRLIDLQMAHPASSVDILVHAICAYCLVTSASSSDAVKHFRQIRLDKLRQRLENDEKTRVQIRESFQYLVSSVQLLKSLLGRSVNDALGQSQKQPILQDHSIQKLDALDIGRLRTLIPHDILTFTPYIKRVLLKQEEVHQISSDWVQDACQIFAKGLEDALIAVNSIDDVLVLRQDLLAIILPVYFSINARDALLQTVRHATTSHVLRLCESQAQTLVDVSRTMVAQRSEPAVTPMLWESALAQQHLASNSTSYAHQVRYRHLGTKGGLNHSVKKVRSWAKQMAHLRNQFQTLETTRWQDLLEEPDDEDEEAAKAVISTLSQDDPEQFKRAVRSTTEGAVLRFNRILRDASFDIAGPTPHEGEIHQAARTVYLLRALRESSAILSTSVSDAKLDTTDLALQLHKSLAAWVAERVASFMDSDGTLTDGNHFALEDVPTPGMFKLLRQICKVMADVGGTDIWSLAAVSEVKDKLRADLLETKTRPTYVSTEFDEHFLRAALSTQHNNTGKDVIDVQSKAVAYWQRTKLLFGALS